MRVSSIGLRRGREKRKRKLHGIRSIDREKRIGKKKRKKKKRKEKTGLDRPTREGSDITALRSEDMFL